MQVSTTDTDLDLANNGANASAEVLGCPVNYYGPTCSVFCTDCIFYFALANWVFDHPNPSHVTIKALATTTVLVIAKLDIVDQDVR